MAKYKALKAYYSGSQQRELLEGEVFEVTDAQLVKALDESVKKHGPGFLEKLTEKKPTRKTKVEEGE